MIQQLITMWDERPNDLLEETLKYNRQIWLLFYDTAMDDQKNSRPDALRNNIINLANFIFKREIDILANPAKEKLGILLNINHEISAGLMENTAHLAISNKNLNCHDVADFLHQMQVQSAITANQSVVCSKDKCYLENGDVRDSCIKQINEYQDLVK